jgi:hypothetical protein
MRRILIAGAALAALAATPVMAQTGRGGGNPGGNIGGNTGNNTQEQKPVAPNALGTNGAERLKPGTNQTTSAGLNEGEARAKLEANGFSNVSRLSIGPDGLWHGVATKGSTPMNVGLDHSGNVVVD